MQNPSFFQNSNYSFFIDIVICGALLLVNYSIAIKQSINTPYSLILLIRFPTANWPFTRGETLFHFPFIIFLEPNSCSENILRQF